MTSWRKREIRLADDHRWKARPGHQIVVLDRGAVSFQVPKAWAVVPEGRTLAVYDKAPPDDDARLQVSLFHHPGVADWTGLPLATLLHDATSQPDPDDAPDDDPDDDGETGRDPHGPIVSGIAPAHEYAWHETAFVDKTERRAARSRTCVARGRGVHALATLDYWVDDARQAERVWDVMLRSLKLGEVVADPSKGPRR